MNELPPLNLNQLQKDSYAWFLKEGLFESLEEISPIEDFTGKNWRLTIEKPELGRAKHTAKEAIDKGLNFDAPLHAEALLENIRAEKKMRQTVFLGDFPLMTERGTFIINGIERAVVNQIVRAPGVYILGEVDVATGQTLHFAEVRPLRGSWLEFHVARNGTVTVRIDRRRKFPATVFLRAIGLSTNEEILKAFADTPDALPLLEKTLEKDPTTSQDEALLELYKKLRPGDPVVLENARVMLNTMFFDPRRYTLGRTGRYKMNKRLGVNLPNIRDYWVMTKDDILATLKLLFSVQRGMGRVDDIDHLANRCVRRVGELVQQNALRVGLLRLERPSREGNGKPSPRE